MGHLTLKKWHMNPDSGTMVSFLLLFSSMKQVTHDTRRVTTGTWHLTNDIGNWTFDTWHVTTDMWHLTPTKWHMTPDYGVGVWFLLLHFMTGCDRLQVIGQNWHITYDTWHMDMRPDMWQLKLTRDTSHLTMGWVSGFTVSGACHLSHVRKATAWAKHLIMCIISLDVRCHISGVQCQVLCVMWKCHMPGVTCQVSFIRCYVSLVTCQKR